jgi:hypothetical protein
MSMLSKNTLHVFHVSMYIVRLIGWLTISQQDDGEITVLNKAVTLQMQSCIVAATRRWAGTQRVQVPGTIMTAVPDLKAQRYDRQLR